MLRKLASMIMLSIPDNGMVSTQQAIFSKHCYKSTNPSKTTEFASFMTAIFHCQKLHGKELNFLKIKR
jgi:hypothetical protein